MFAQLFVTYMILVTGATGLLGSHLIQALLQQHLPVKALYRSAIPSTENADKVEWIQADILNMPLLEDIMRNVQQVYHCAAMVSFNSNESENLFKINVEGTANVVNACLASGVKKLLHVSSVAALGRAKANAATDETIPWSDAGNRSIYGKTKYLAEMEVWRGVGEGLNAVIINPSVILGAGNWNGGSSQLFKTAYNEFLWYTDGITGFVDVLDVVKAALLLMNSDSTGERFIINAENTRYKDVFDMMADCFSKKRPHRKVTPLLAALIWRAEKIRQLFTNSHPLLTRETAASAQEKLFFSNEKFYRAFPDFRYQPLPQTIFRICTEFIEYNHL